MARHPSPPPEGRSSAHSAERAVVELSARAAGRSAIVWGYVLAAFVAASAWSYAGFYKTPTQRARLQAAYGDNRAMSALFGSFRLDTVAGFTLYKTFLVTVVLAALWGLLTTTRLLRGAEEAGRWHLLVGGAASPRKATVLTLAGASAGALVIFALAALIVAIVGRSARVGIGAGSAVYLALMLVSCALMFAAVGALTSQLAATRRQAAGLAGLVLGVSYAVRVVADSGAGRQWLLWLSPLGWLERLRPLGAFDPVALAPLAGFTLICAVVAVVLAGRRDVGASILPDRATTARRFRGGSLVLVARLTLPASAAWCTAIALGGLLYGFVAKDAGSSFSGSVVQVFARLGAAGGATRSYLGVCFLITAFVLGLFAASLVVAVRNEEATGHAVHLLSRPVSRERWYLERLGTAAVVLTAAGLAVGLTTWIGVSGARGAPSLASSAAAGLNTVPPALCVLGLGAVAFAVRPRATTLVAYGVLTWSLLVEVLAGIGPVNHWLVDTSLFHQMSAAPAAPVDTTVVAALLALAAVTVAIGLAAFRRRDLAGA